MIVDGNVAADSHLAGDCEDEWLRVDLMVISLQVIVQVSSTLPFRAIEIFGTLSRQVCMSVVPGQLCNKLILL